jgi:hypothetical protein
MPLKIAAFTMAHNEHRMLPLWMQHYGKLVGVENTYVIDHGSTDGSTFPYAASCLRVPRRYNGADVRLPIVNGLQSALLAEYDVVIYTDCDEFLLIDPAHYASLPEALEATDGEIIRCLGADLVHLPGVEPEQLDFARSIFSQRKYWYYSRPISKPIITRTVADWVPGFHFVRGKDLKPNPAFLLVHLRWADVTHALERMRMTRSMEWSPTAMSLGWGAHARQDDGQVLAFYRGKEAERPKEGAEESDLQSDGMDPEKMYGRVRLVYPRLRNLF